MSQILRYRQYWMATLKDRHACQICGDLAVNAQYTVGDCEVIKQVIWSCIPHIGTFNDADMGSKN